MAKKDTQKKLQEILDKKRKAEEELKAVKKQLAKEEREERKKCYLEMGKALESCLSRNFCEEDIASFEAFIRENEELISGIFEDEESSDTETDVPESYDDDSVSEDGEPASGTSNDLPFGQ